MLVIPQLKYLKVGSSEMFVGLDLHHEYYSQWEFQDPKMEVLCHIRLYIVVIFPYIGLKIGLVYGRYLQFRFLRWPVTLCYVQLATILLDFIVY